MPRTIRIAATVLALALATPAAAESGDVHPIVSGYLLGGSANGRWLSAGDVAPKLKGGVTYRHYNLISTTGSGKGGRAESVGDPCPGTMQIDMRLPAEGSLVALAADWNALPRVPKFTGTGQRVYREAAAAFLEERGIGNPDVKLTEVIRIDLDGDGVDEVLVAGTRHGGSAPGEVRPGDYSFVFLRKLAGDKVRTVQIVADIHPDPTPNSVPYQLNVAAILDLNGDGVMEIVTYSEYYEGDAVAVHTVEGLKVNQVLIAGCGA